MKNFIVSNARDLWITECKELYISEPYVYHVLEKNKEIGNYDDIEVAEYYRQSKEDLQRDSDFVDIKYRKYLLIMAKRLNKIHHKNYEVVFWQKALSLGFIRYITIFHNLFQRFEKYYNSDNHISNILSKKSFFTPFDFEDHRNYFQNSDLGAEQIFSIYLSLFYPKQNNDVCLNNSLNKNEIKNIKFYQKITPLKSVIRILIKNLLLQKKKYKVTKDVVIGVLGTCISEENKERLVTKSNNRIHIMDYTFDWQLANKFYNNKFYSDKRKIISSTLADFDRFDNFFFTSLIYCFPKAFVENFRKIECSLKYYMSFYEDLKYILSEIWISNTYLSICIAVGQDKGIKHITNEHNAFTHPYVGILNQYIVELSDIFLSLGWKSLDDNIKFIPGGSLYPFKHSSCNYKKRNKILYVSGCCDTRIPHYLAHYGNLEEGVSKSISFIKCFFANLKDNTIAEISYRRYPNELYYIPILAYDKEYFLEDYLNKMKEMVDVNIPGRVNMLESSLVIIDYLSTSYLESLIMDIPTIFFWDSNVYYLKDEYADFFNPLIKVGICHSNPETAAKFLEQIKDDPEKWWHSKKTQKGRIEFLSKNIGKPEKMLNYLNKLTN